jgi:peptide/nickel transport system permease protein
MAEGAQIGIADRPGRFRLAADFGRLRSLGRTVGKNPGFALGATTLLVIVVAALAAPYVAPHDPYDFDLARRLRPPFWHEGSDPRFLLGTDKVGRDYLSRLIYGARVSLLIGLVAVAISGIIGTILGLLAGYYGGRVDQTITFLVNTRLALPVVLVALAVTVVAGASLTVVAVVIGLLLWARFTIVIRATTLQLRDREFVLAARAMGCSTPHILLREILPNLEGSLFVIVSLEMANAILLEASLSFLGFGAQPPTASWGLMLADARDFVLFSPWLVAIPGVALTILILAINLLGDGLRDFTHDMAQGRA